MIFTGPKIAMLVASGSFLSIAATVMTISKVSPQTLRKAHYTKMDIYGHAFHYSFWDMVSYSALFSNTNIEDKTFTCKLEGKFFECSIVKINKSDVPKIQTTSQECSATTTEATYAKIAQQTAIYKINGPRDKMWKWQNVETIQLQIIDKDKKIQYAGLGIKPFFSVDGTLDKCINPKT